MDKSKKIGLCIIIGFAVLGIAGSSVLFFVEPHNGIVSIISLWSGIIGTTASVVLSVVAMVYSNKSSQDAEESLKKVTDQYKILFDKLKSEEIINTLGKRGIEKIIENYQDK